MALSHSQKFWLEIHQREKGGKNPEIFLSPSSTSWMRGFDSTLSSSKADIKKKKLSHTKFQMWNTSLFLLQFLCLGPEWEALHPFFLGYYYLHIYQWDILCFVCFRLFSACSEPTRPIYCTQSCGLHHCWEGQRLYQGSTKPCNIQTASQVLLERL